MKLIDLVATLVAVPPTAAVAAAHTYQVGAGSANADGVVGFALTIDGESHPIFFIPGSTAAAAAIGAELKDIANALDLPYVATDNGTGLVTLTSTEVSTAGNDDILDDVTTDTGIAAGTIAQPVLGVNGVPASNYVSVDDSTNPVIKFTVSSLTSNPSMVARLLRKNGYEHDLDTQKTSGMMSHAFVIRILEQL